MSNSIISCSTRFLSVTGRFQLCINLDPPRPTSRTVTGRARRVCSWSQANPHCRNSLLPAPFVSNKLSNGADVQQKGRLPIREPRLHVVSPGHTGAVFNLLASCRPDPEGGLTAGPAVGTAPRTRGDDKVVLAIPVRWSSAFKQRGGSRRGYAVMLWCGSRWWHGAQKCLSQGNWHSCWLHGPRAAWFCCSCLCLCR